jgi:ribosomal protein S27AE
MDEECPNCGQDSMYWDSFGTGGGEYVCGNCGYTMRNEIWDEAIENDPEAQEMIRAMENNEAKFMDDLYENADPIETLTNNIPKYIEQLILEGDEDAVIKSKVIAELLIVGLNLSDPNALDDEIASIRKKLTNSEV